jgi:hypothetical protein
MIENEDLLYYIDEDFKESLMAEFRTFTGIARVANISHGTVKNMFVDDMPVRYNVAEALAKLSNEPIEELFHTGYPYLVEKDVSGLALSEDIIMGLRNNIYQRLLKLHHINYVNDIIEVVDDIIKEASYLGVQLQKENKADVIEKAIHQRRK